MVLHVIGKNVTITEAMRSQIENKMSKFVSKLFDNPEQVEVNVTISVHKFDQAVEISVTDQGVNLRSKCRGTDMYEALDLCTDTLEGQMRKVKTKIQKSKKQNNIFKNLVLSNYDEDDEIVDVVKKKKLVLTPMDQDEAITRMEALGHSFFIYLDSSTGKVNVLYNRDDGAYGLIEIQD